MKKLSLFVFYVVLFVVIIVVLSPKRYLYNFAEHTALQEKIIFSHEKIHDKLFFLEVSNADIYVQDIFIGSFEKMTVYPFIFFNQVTCKDFGSSKDIENFFSTSIDTASFFQWMGEPYKIRMNMQGSFGSASGFVQLKERKVYVKIQPAKSFISQLDKLNIGVKKGDGGEYIYEYGY